MTDRQKILLMAKYWKPVWRYHKKAVRRNTFCLIYRIASILLIVFAAFYVFYFIPHFANASMDTQYDFIKEMRFWIYLGSVVAFIWGIYLWYISRDGWNTKEQPLKDTFSYHALYKVIRIKKRILNKHKELFMEYKPYFDYRLIESPMYFREVAKQIHIDEVLDVPSDITDYAKLAEKKEYFYLELRYGKKEGQIDGFAKIYLPTDEWTFDMDSEWSDTRRDRYRC